MSTKTSRVALVGAALSDIGRVDTKTPFELHYQAASRAIADAGLTKADIDGFGSCGMGLLAPVEIAEYLGLRPTWADGTGVGGSTWEFMVEHATAAILAGHVETVVLVYGSTARADLKARRRSANLSFGARGPVQFDAPFGHTPHLEVRDGRAAPHVRVRHHHRAARRDRGVDALQRVAQPRGVLPGADHDRRRPDARMMADPLTKLHCCIRSDGGGAVVLTSEERARDLPKPPVWVLGTGEATSHTTMSEWEDFTESPAARSGQLAFERAGVKPEDIDICEIYDAFTPMVLLSFEGLGFCKKGEGGAFVEDGKLRVGGALPTNTDGGGLSHCHPGMRGMFLLVEAVRQLRGEAAGRQVEGAQLACVNGTGGWFSSASTVILGVD